MHNCAEVRVGPNSITNLGVTLTGTTVKYEFEAFPEWIDYVATFSSQGGGASIGNGYSAAWYKRNGNTITIHGVVSFGSTSSYGSGGFRVLLPVPAKSRAGFFWMGSAAVSGSAYNRDIQVYTEGGASFVQFATASGVAVGATTPHTWTSGDTLRWQLTYECG